MIKYIIGLALLLNTIIINTPDDVVVCTETHGVTICN